MKDSVENKKVIIENLEKDVFTDSENLELNAEQLQQKIDQEIKQIEDYSEQITDIPDRQEKQIEDLGGDTAVVEEKLKPEFNVLKSIRENVGGRFAKVTAILGLMTRLNTSHAEQLIQGDTKINNIELKDNETEQKKFKSFEEARQDPRYFLDNIDYYEKQVPVNKIVDVIENIYRQADYEEIIMPYADRLLQIQEVRPIVLATIKDFISSQEYALFDGRAAESSTTKFLSILIKEEPSFISEKPEMIILFFNELNLIPNSKLDVNALLLEAADKDPDLFVRFLKKYNNIPGVQEKTTLIIRNFPVQVSTIPLKRFKPYLVSQDTAIISLLEEREQQMKVISKNNELYEDYVLSQEKLLSDRLLLLEKIINNGLSRDDADKIVKDKDMLLKELIDIKTIPNHLGDGSIEKELELISLKNIRAINDLHESPDNIRFKSVENSSPVEMYTMLSYGGDEVFTSTFRKMFTQLLIKLEQEKIGGYELLEQVGHSKSRVFIKECAGYGKLDDFLETMSPAQQKEVLVSVIKDLEKQGNKLEQASSAIDIINYTEKQPEIKKVLKDQIKQEYDKVTSEDDKKIFGILGGFSADNSADGWYSEMKDKYKLDNIDLSSVDSEKLFNEKGVNVQEYFFYNDKDGKASFQSFLAQYENKSDWNVDKKEDFVKISSLASKGKKIEIYANYPEADEEGSTKVKEFLKKSGLEPSIIVHRGHSYHTASTINNGIQSTAKIVMLGSCGGYNNMSKVLEKSSNAHIISTKGEGTMMVNDPMFKELNRLILSGKDIEWSDFWATMEKKVGKDDRFYDYVAPNKNASLIFLNAYNKVIKQQQK